MKQQNEGNEKTMQTTDAATDQTEELYEEIQEAAEEVQARAQAFYRALCVFPGHFTAEQAEKVCREARAGEYLAALRLLGRVIADETETGTQYRLPADKAASLRAEFSEQGYQRLTRRYARYGHDDTDGVHEERGAYAASALRGMVGWSSLLHAGVSLR